MHYEAYFEANSSSETIISTNYQLFNKEYKSVVFEVTETELQNKIFSQFSWNCVSIFM